MIRALVLTVVWLGLLAYAFLGAPAEDPQTAQLIEALVAGNWVGINPAIVALFNLMGVWPLAYAGLALMDGHHQRIPAWPFVLGSMALGAFVLLPYLILRRSPPASHAVGTYTLPQGLLRRWLLAWVESRWWGLGILLGSLGLGLYGLAQGDWPGFLAQWQSNRFIHVMGLDFCLLWLLIPLLLGEDMSRRGLRSPGLMALIAAVPLVGLGAYLTLRPPLVGQVGGEAS